MHLPCGQTVTTLLPHRVHMESLGERQAGTGLPGRAAAPVGGSGIQLPLAKPQNTSRIMPRSLSVRVSPTR